MPQSFSIERPATPAERLASVAKGDRVILWRTARQGDRWSTLEWVADIHDVEARDGYLYVGWTRPLHVGDPDAGSWGRFRLYPESRDHETRVLRRVRKPGEPITGWDRLPACPDCGHVNDRGALRPNGVNAVCAGCGGYFTTRRYSPAELARLAAA